MIKIFHFDTGLSIVADEENGSWEYPMVFQHQIDPNGKIIIMFQPMFLFSKEPTMTPKKLNGLLFESEAEDKLKEKYKAIVMQARSAASGIVTPGGLNIQLSPNIRKNS